MFVFVSFFTPTPLKQLVYEVINRIFRPRLIKSSKRLTAQIQWDSFSIIPCDWMLYFLLYPQFFFLIVLSFWLSHTIDSSFSLTVSFFLCLFYRLCSVFESILLVRRNIFLFWNTKNVIRMQNILRHNSFVFYEIFTVVEWWHVETVLIMDIIYIVKSPKRKLSFDFLWMLSAFKMILAIEPYVFLYFCYKFNDTTNAAYNVCFLYKICIRFITQ